MRRLLLVVRALSAYPFKILKKEGLVLSAMLNGRSSSRSRMTGLNGKQITRAPRVASHRMLVTPLSRSL
jgi:hypothetical protein